jgi:hypothetical protein
MKHVSEHERTLQGLRKWAGAKKLLTASFYFWNQGNEMQKSGVGLFQSLLYQILRAAPSLATTVYPDHLPHEVWDQQTLKTTFQKIAEDTKLDVKFCFFIDGLDEYNGDEKDVLLILEALSVSRNIKICASSRPGRVYEQWLQKQDRMFDIAQFTMKDMHEYVQTLLLSSGNFRRRAYVGLGKQIMDPAYQQIITDISKWAKGVWLWVFLVTREIIHEVDRGEDIETFRKIVDEFPSDLQKYFERIIEKIKDRHKEEMAQTFRITVEELQPLPLYAFALLEQERKDPDYAMKTPIQAIPTGKLLDQYPQWRSRVQNRCGDLLVVDDKPHPVFLSHSVDFLHRTVRDFLRDCYHDQLQGHLKANFDPLMSLCKIYLCFLKGLSIDNFRDPDTVNKVIGLTDELLYYAHEVEIRSPPEQEVQLFALLDELDRVNKYHARNIRVHWTHARDPANQGLEKFIEGGNCNFLALAIQTRLVKYVRAKLLADPLQLKKSGRPLLDYALRPRRSTPISMPYHSTREEASVNLDMIEMLLEKGADPNQAVFLYDGETVWGLFLLSIHSSNMAMKGFVRPSETLKNAWFGACRALVRVGADLDYKFIGKYSSTIDMDALTIIQQVFGDERRAVLVEDGEEYTSAHRSSKCVIM